MDMEIRRALLLASVAASPALGGGGVVPFTSEHAARGVIYNMMLAPPLVNPQDGFGMALADLDGDGYVSGSDLGPLLTQWGCHGACTTDLDGDGWVGRRRRA